MSGIYIPGMEMPTSCADCRLMADGWCYSVGLEQREKISTVKRPTWCPLVPVLPHGDLIDRRDAIIDANERAYDFWLSDDEVNATIQFLKEQPTIIPAEEGE